MNGPEIMRSLIDNLVGHCVRIKVGFLSVDGMLQKHPHPDRSDTLLIQDQTGVWSKDYSTLKSIGSSQGYFTYSMVKSIKVEVGTNDTICAEISVRPFK